MAAPRPETVVRLTDIVADLVLSRLGNTGTDLLNDLFSKLNSALAIPGELQVTGTNKIVTVGNTVVTTGPSNKKASLPLLDGVDIGNITGTFNFGTGVGTGDVLTQSLPTMTASYFVRAGFEVRVDKKVYVVFGSEAASAAAAPAPSFSENAIKLGEVLLQDNGTGGAGNYVNVVYADVYQFKCGDVGASSELVAQDRNIKMVKGGTWLWNSGTGALSFSANAYIQVAGLTEVRNTIPTSASPITLSADGKVAYVTINRTAGGASNLSISVTDIDTLVDGPNTVVIARRVGSDVLVGNGTILLKTGERLELDGALAEINRYFGQLRATAHESALNKARISGADQTLLNGTVLGQELKNLLLSFSGAVINFTSGAILKEDDATALGQNFTPFAVPVGHYFWYGFAMIPSTVGGDGRILGQILTTPASASNAVQASAPFPAIGGTKKLGAILVRNNAGSIEVVEVRQLGVGSGSGGGGIDQAALFQEDLKARLRQSFFEWVTPNVIAIHEDARVDGTSTGSYDVANSLYKLDVSEFLLSKQSYGARFLAEQRESLQAELMVSWETEPTTATYQVSQNGGATFESVTMDRIGTSKILRGVKVLTTPVGTIQSTYALANANATAELNTTTRQAYAIKQPVIASGTKKRVVSGTVYVNKVGLPTGDLIVKLVSDSGGVPGTTILGQNSTVINIATLTAGNNAIPIVIPAIVTAQTYWLVIETSQAYKNVFSTGVTALSVRVDTSSPSYSEGDSFQYSGSWAAHAGNHAVFELVGFNYDLRVKVTATVGSGSIAGYGAFYGESAPQIYNNEQFIERVDINGNLDTTEVTLVKFIPDAMKLRVYDVNSGQVYRYPSFAIDGRKVVFAAGQFLSPGETIIVLFDQAEQGAFDNSDVNGNLLASNHLGSTDASIDRSVAGRGVVLRRPDGTLRELRINNADGLDILTVP